MPWILVNKLSGPSSWESTTEQLAGLMVQGRVGVGGGSEGEVEGRAGLRMGAGVEGGEAGLGRCIKAADLSVHHREVESIPRNRKEKGNVYFKSTPIFQALCYTVLKNFTMKYKTRLERWLIGQEHCLLCQRTHKAAGSRPSVMPEPGDLTLSGLCGHCTHMEYRHTHMQNTHRHKTKLKLKRRRK